MKSYKILYTENNIEKIMYVFAKDEIDAERQLTLNVEDWDADINIINIENIDKAYKDADEGSRYQYLQKMAESNNLSFKRVVQEANALGHEKDFTDLIDVLDNIAFSSTDTNQVTEIIDSVIAELNSIKSNINELDKAKLTVKITDAISALVKVVGL